MQHSEVAVTITQHLQPLPREVQLQVMERAGRLLGIDLGVDLVRSLQQARTRVEKLEAELANARGALRCTHGAAVVTPESVVEACGATWQRARDIATRLGTTLRSNQFSVAMRRAVVAGQLERTGVGRGAMYRRKQ